jgi:hypothetical protein
MREYVNDNFHPTAAHNATTTSGIHVSASWGDHIPNTININSNIEIWCPFRAFGREHMLYSIALGDAGDHFLLQLFLRLRIFYAMLQTIIVYNNTLGITSTPSLDSSSGDNEYDGRNGARDEPEAEAFVQ